MNMVKEDGNKLRLKEKGIWKAGQWQFAVATLERDKQEYEEGVVYFFLN